MKAMFDGFAAKFAKGEDKPADTAPPTPPAAGTGAKEPANDNFAQFASQFGETMTQAIAAAFTPLNNTVASIQTDLSALKQQVETTEAPNSFQRKAATGGNGAVLTDC